MPRIHLYPDPHTKTLGTKEIAEYIEKRFPSAKVDTRANFTDFFKFRKNVLAESLAKAKIRDLTSQKKIAPFPAEIEHEKRILGGQMPSQGIIYDALALSKIFCSLIPEKERNLNHIHIIFTRMLFATFEGGRYHARVILCSFPTLISTSGIVEAPAMPREYYILKQNCIAGGIPVEIARDKFSGKFIDYDDERMTQVMKGYAMQAIFYHIAGEAFCENKDCILYNAHWQDEVIRAQIASGKLCRKHEEMPGKLAKA